MKIGILDIGSNKISCFIGNLEKDKDPEIIGIGHHSSEGIKSGVITDMELAQKSIISTIQSAENMCDGETVEEFIVNFSSNTIQSNIVNFSVSLGGNEITYEDIKNIDKKLENLPLGKDRSLIHKIPTSYTVDGQRGITNPIGLKGNVLIAGFNLVTASKNILDNFINCLSTCRVKVSDIVVTPYASGLGCLNEDEFFIGTTVIDIGSGNTSIATFFNNKLIYANSFELGGQNISSDIARGLSTPLSEAERLKILHGSNLNEFNGDEFIDIFLSGNENTTETHKIPKKVLTNIINSRLKEIFEIVRSKVCKSVLNKKFTNKIVLTGDSSRLKGITEMASNILGSRVRLGKPVGVKKLAENKSGPGFSVSAGLMKYKNIKDNFGNRPEGVENSLIFRKFGTWIRESFF